MGRRAAAAAAQRRRWRQRLRAGCACHAPPQSPLPPMLAGSARAGWCGDWPSFGCGALGSTCWLPPPHCAPAGEGERAPSCCWSGLADRRFHLLSPRPSPPAAFRRGQAAPHLAPRQHMWRRQLPRLLAPPAGAAMPTRGACDLSIAVLQLLDSSGVTVVHNDQQRQQPREPSEGGSGQRARERAAKGGSRRWHSEQAAKGGYN